MADYEVENLKITLTVDDSDVVAKIKSIKDAFKGLGDAVRGEGTASAIKALSEGFKTFAEVLPQIAKASESINKFTEGLKSADMETFKKGLLDIGNAFSGVKFNEEAARGITSFSTALKALSKSATDFKPTGLERVVAAGSQLDAVANSVKKASSVGSGLRDLASGIAHLPSSMENFAKVDFNTWTANISKAVQRLVELNKVTTTLDSKGTHSISSLAGALKTLSEFGKEDSELAKNLSNSSTVIISFARNIANAISDDTLKKFKELALATARLAVSVKQIGRANFERVIGPQSLKSAMQGRNLNAGQEVGGFFKTPKLPLSFLDHKETLKELKKYNDLAKVVAKDLKKTFSDTGKSYQNFAKVISAPITLSIKGASATVRVTGSILKKAFSGISSAYRVMTRILGESVLASPLKTLANTVTDLHKRFTNFLSSIRRIAIYRAIRSGIKMITSAAKEGIDNLYNWALIVGNDFAPTMDSLATSALYAKNSFAAMASPLIDALAPAFEAVVDRAVQFMNVLNQTFATLTGKDTWRKAIRKQAEYTSEINNSSGALKELKATILGIDEINPLNDQPNRGRGSSDITPDYEGMFEVVDVAEEFNKTWKNSDWASLGSTLSNGLSKALDSIDWAKVKQKVNGVVGNTVSFFNGFFGNTQLWKSAAVAASEGLNTITGAMLTFTDNADFEQIGNNIAEGVRTSITTIDWANLGRTSVSGIKVFTKLFHGFTQGMSPQDWEALGVGIRDAVDSAISDIDWAQSFADLKSFSNGLLTALSSATRGISWEKLGKTISNGVTTSLGKINWTTIQGKLKTFGSKLGELLNGIFTNKSMFDEVGNGFGNGLNGITGAINEFQNTFNGRAAGMNLQKGLMSAVKKIDWPSLGRSLIAGLKIGLDIFHGFVSSMSASDWEYVGSEIGDMINEALQGIDWERTIKDLVSFTSGLLKALVSAAKKIKWREILKEILNGAKGADWGGLFSNLGDFLTETWPVFVIPLAFNGLKLLKDVALFSTQFKGSLGGISSAATSTSKIVSGAINGGMIMPILSLIGTFGTLGVVVNEAFNAESDAARDSTNVLVDNLLQQGAITKKQANEFKAALYVGSRDAKAEVERQVAEIARQYNLLPPVAERTGKKIPESLRNGINGGKSFVTSAVNSILAEVKKINTSVPDTTPAGTKATQGIANGAKNNRKAITSVLGEIVADFTGVRVPDKTAEGAKLPKTLGAGVKNNRSAMKTSINEVVADFTGVKSVDKSAVGASFPKTIAKGVNDNKATASKALNDVKALLTIPTPNLAGVGRAVPVSLAKGMNDNSKAVGNAVTAIANKVKILNSSRDDSPFYPYTWGTHLAQNFADGLSSQSSYVDKAARNVAQTARNVLAFSKPKLGPLSDADTYGPDFAKLFAEGLEQKDYLVAAAAKHIAQVAEMNMPVAASYSNTTTATLGSDSAALIRSVAQGAEDANAAQNELLREQNELLRQILAKSGEGVTAGAILGSMERANRRAGVAVSTIS